LEFNEHSQLIEPMARKPAKPKKEFDWNQFHERQIALRVAYIGWDLKGFVLQGDEKTVEFYLFDALERARLIRDRKDCHYSLCGRTDTGVSGVGNVVSLRVRSVCPNGVGAVRNDSASIRPEEMNYAQILNGILPPEIRITEYAYVPLEFNARFQCLTRGYRYFFHRFGKDVEKMKRAAGDLIGEHDFRGFCKFSPANTSHCVRRIDKIEFGEVENDVWYFEIVGSGFIWHQIRCIATVLFFVGDGLEEPTVVRELLDIAKYPGRPQYPIAAPEPLVFWRAEYSDVEWLNAGANVEARIQSAFGSKLIDLEMKTAVMRCFTGGPPTPPPLKAHTKIEKLPMVASVEEVLAEYHRTLTPVDPIGDE
jgi:tRNA pseudouridine38/39 synthase